MKKIFKVLGRPFKPFFNFSTFLGLKELKGSYENVASLTKETFARKKPEDYVQETFEEAMKRLNLKEEDIALKQKGFLTMSICYLSIATLLMVYMVYLFFTGVLLGTFISFILIVVALSFCYREHFWYTQMHHRRLGLTFQDWKAYTFSGSKK